MNSPGRQRQVLQITKHSLAGLKTRDQFVAAQNPGIVMNLQRANTRRDIDDPGKVLLPQKSFELMYPETQIQIQNIRTNFDKEIPISGGAIDDVVMAVEYGRRVFF